MNQKKEVYLTIDDSPSQGFIPKVNFLLEHKIPAVLFCIGNLMEQRPDDIIYAIKNGFVIANHSWSHPHFSDINLEQAYQEIKRTDQLIDRLYAAAKVARTSKWFRFPYGDKGDLRRGNVLDPKAKIDQARKEGIQDILYHLKYTQPAFENIEYRFMRDAKLFEDIDWHWTFDIMEWSVIKGNKTFGISKLKHILDRLDTKKPRDCRGGDSAEMRWLSAPQSPEIVLFHDHDETDDIFIPILNHMLNLPIQFCAIPSK